MIERMDLSAYIKKSETARRISRVSTIEKKCLECGRRLEKEDTASHLFLQSFCSEQCKGRYVGAEP